MMSVRDALAAYERGQGTFDQVREAVAAATFTHRPARSLNELAATWFDRPAPDSWASTVQAALFTGVITRDQYEELSALVDRR